MLKVVPVLIHYGRWTLDTFTILDDGSERTMLLPTSAKYFDMKGGPEDLPLRTVHQDIQVLHKHTVSLSVSSAAKLHTTYKIEGTFTASHLSLAQDTYSIHSLQRKFSHLWGPLHTSLKGSWVTCYLSQPRAKIIVRHLWNKPRSEPTYRAPPSLVQLGRRA